MIKKIPKHCFDREQLPFDSYDIMTNQGLYEEPEIGITFFESCEKMTIEIIDGREMICIGENRYGTQHIYLDKLTGEVFYAHTSRSNKLFLINGSLQKLNQSMLAYSAFASKVGEADPIDLIESLKSALVDIDSGSMSNETSFWASMIDDMENDY